MTAETPPRAWGKQTFHSVHPMHERNTPTGVGKTPWIGKTDFWTGKHPHGRGENIVSPVPFGTDWETPPRAWGKRSRRP